MRTIKFRVWSKATEEMFSDYPLVIEENGKISLNKIFDEKDYDFMQFTGLTDKNGKEIYEGDIVETNNYNGKHKFEISYENDFCGCLGAFHASCIDDDQISSVHSEVCTDCKVIGNIYEK